MNTEQDPYSLRKFTDMINEVTDQEMLDVADNLMSDMAVINNMKQKIEMMEAELHKGKRAAFYFFTLNLDSDEISLAAQTVKGRKRVISAKTERIASQKAKEEAAAAESDETTEALGGEAVSTNETLGELSDSK